MYAIADTPLNAAHLNWRLAERNLLTQQLALSLKYFRTVIEQLERAKLLSQDRQTISCLDKQIEFHRRRVDLLTADNCPEDGDEDVSVCDRDGYELLRGAFEEIGEPMIETKECEQKLTESEIDIDIVSIPEMDTQIPALHTSIQLTDMTDENQIHSFLARIAELESENKALNQSLRKERSENQLLMQSIKDLTELND